MFLKTNETSTYQYTIDLVVALGLDVLHTKMENITCQHDALHTALGG